MTFNLNQALQFCVSERSWLIDTTVSLARLESPTPDKVAVDRCGVELVSLFEGIGADVDQIAQDLAGNHIRATFGNGSPQVLLLGHFDTVWPIGQAERMPVHEQQGRLYGPGVYDMKAGIAIAILAIRALKAQDALFGQRVVVLLTSDEERGSVTSRKLIEMEAGRSNAVLVLEPSLPGGAAKTARKGVGEFELKIEGVSAHAGIEPQNGASAIHELARQVVALEPLREAGISVNVGLVEGGSGANVVAEQARCVIDVRVESTEDCLTVEKTLNGLKPSIPGTSVQLTGGFSRPPFERTEEVLALYELAKAVAAELGYELGEGPTGGASDGNLTASLGIPTLDGLGAVGAGAHALHEHVEIAELPWRAAMVAGLVDRVREMK